MSACRECPKCRGWGKLLNRAQAIIDCDSCRGSGCAKHKAPAHSPVAENCSRLRAQYPRGENGGAA